VGGRSAARNLIVSPFVLGVRSSFSIERRRVSLPLVLPLAARYSLQFRVRRTFRCVCRLRYRTVSRKFFSPTLPCASRDLFYIVRVCLVNDTAQCSSRLILTMYSIGDFSLIGTVIHEQILLMERPPPRAH